MTQLQQTIPAESASVQTLYRAKKTPHSGEGMWGCVTVRLFPGFRFMLRRFHRTDFFDPSDKFLNFFLGTAEGLEACYRFSSFRENLYH